MIPPQLIFAAFNVVTTVAGVFKGLREASKRITPTVKKEVSGLNKKLSNLDKSEPLETPLDENDRSFANNDYVGNSSLESASNSADKEATSLKPIAEELEKLDKKSYQRSKSITDKLEALTGVVTGYGIATLGTSAASGADPEEVKDKVSDLGALAGTLILAESKLERAIDNLDTLKDKIAFKISKLLPFKKEKLEGSDDVNDSLSALGVEAPKTGFKEGTTLYYTSKAAAFATEDAKNDTDRQVAIRAEVNAETKLGLITGANQKTLGDTSFTGEDKLNLYSTYLRGMLSKDLIPALEYARANSLLLQGLVPILSVQTMKGKHTPINMDDLAVDSDNTLPDAYGVVSPIITPLAFAAMAAQEENDILSGASARQKEYTDGFQVNSTSRKATAFSNLSGSISAVDSAGVLSGTSDVDQRLWNPASADTPEVDTPKIHDEYAPVLMTKEPTVLENVTRINKAVGKDSMWTKSKDSIAQAISILDSGGTLSSVGSNFIPMDSNPLPEAEGTFTKTPEVPTLKSSGLSLLANSYQADLGIPSALDPKSLLNSPSKPMDMFNELMEKELSVKKEVLSPAPVTNIYKEGETINNNNVTILSEPSTIGRKTSGGKDYLGYIK